MHLKLRAARYQKFHLVICLGPNKQGSSVVSVFSSNFTTETQRFSQRHRETPFFRQTPPRACWVFSAHSSGSASLHPGFMLPPASRVGRHHRKIASLTPKRLPLSGVHSKSH